VKDLSNLSRCTARAMAVVADKLGVAADDVAEMSVPDYGLGELD
jgi:hypothetical protein